MISNKEAGHNIAGQSSNSGVSDQLPSISAPKRRCKLPVLSRLSAIPMWDETQIKAAYYLSRISFILDL
jgi:hypothetical protein